MVIANNHTENIRKSEFELVARELKPDDRLLEIGGGSGFQASLLSRCVKQCISIDVKPHPNPIVPVTIYDGKTLPFDDNSFDVIFSSNVLEHIIDLDDLLCECARVLKPNGMMVHVVPSVSWRIWTTISYYPAMPRILWGNLLNLRNMNSPVEILQSVPKKSYGEGQQHDQNKINRLFCLIRQNFKLKWIRSILLSPRHGERGNELTEAYYYRRSWWRSLFARNGWTVVNEEPCQLFYSGNILFGGVLGLKIRKALSHIFGSSTHLFKLTHAQPSSLINKP